MAQFTTENLRRRIADDIALKNYTSAENELTDLPDGDEYGIIYKELLSSVKRGDFYLNSPIDQGLIFSIMIKLLASGKNAEAFTDLFEMFRRIIESGSLPAILPEELNKLLPEYFYIPPVRRIYEIIEERAHAEDKSVYETLTRKKREDRRAKIVRIAVLGLLAAVVVGCIILSFFI